MDRFMRMGAGLQGFGQVKLSRNNKNTILNKILEYNAWC